MTLERWQNISKRDQLGHIASEIKRALAAESNSPVYCQIVERAITLTDLTLSDSKWSDNPLILLYLRDKLTEAYLGKPELLQKIYAAL